MSDDPQKTVVSSVRWALATLALAVLVGLGFGWVLASWDHPTPVRVAPAGQVAPATSSVRVTGTQGVKVTLQRVVKAPQATGSSEWEVVSVEATQSVLGEASLSVGTTSYVQPDHGRLGVIVGPFPGVVAADLEVGRVDASWLIGKPLELGVDIEANHRQVGVGLTLGNKGFVEVGGFSEWTLSNQGLYLAGGMRF